MQFDEHEGAGGSQYSRDAAHPGVQVVDPAQDANRGVDEVEASVELAGQVTALAAQGRVVGQVVRASSRRARAVGEKSTPVTRAPSRANVIESHPM